MKNHEGGFNLEKNLLFLRRIAVALLFAPTLIFGQVQTEFVSKEYDLLVDKLKGSGEQRSVFEITQRRASIKSDASERLVVDLKSDRILYESKASASPFVKDSKPVAFGLFYTNGTLYSKLNKNTVWVNVPQNMPGFINLVSILSQNALSTILQYKKEIESRTSNILNSSVNLDPDWITQLADIKSELAKIDGPVVDVNVENSDFSLVLQSYANGLVKIFRSKMRGDTNELSILSSNNTEKFPAEEDLGGKQKNP